MIHVLIVDDHTIVRKGIKQLLEDTPDIRVSGEAEHAAEMLRKIHHHHFDVVVLDISLPGRSGVEALKQLKSIKPHLPVLILSMYPEDQYALRVIKSGAAGYLTKESAPGELETAIRKVSAGKRYISSKVADTLADNLNEPMEKPSYKSLSDREFEVLRRIAAGETLTQISQSLSLSVKTISTYRTRILNKLNLNNNSELIRYAIQQRLVDL
ncbi:MAG TPA: response regulator transcription factor [Bacteroidales bacterium]|nr:response regulator transcription factor [Bacteroidales bacterium]